MPAGDAAEEQETMWSQDFDFVSRRHMFPFSVGARYALEGRCHKRDYH